MSATELELDAAASSIRIHTFAEGFLARLAHDLEIAASGMSGSALRGERSTATIDVPVSSFAVVGVVKKGTVDAQTLSAADRADIERRIRSEVFAALSSVHVDAELHDRRATLKIAGAGATASVACDVAIEEAGDVVIVSGRVDLSLKNLGLKTVKGPMGSFKLSDRVEVLFKGAFRARRSP